MFFVMKLFCLSYNTNITLHFSHFNISIKKPFCRNVFLKNWDPMLTHSSLNYHHIVQHRLPYNRLLETWASHAEWIMNSNALLARPTKINRTKGTVVLAITIKKKCVYLEHFKFLVFVLKFTFYIFFPVGIRFV